MSRIQKLLRKSAAGKTREVKVGEHEKPCLTIRSQILLRQEGGIRLPSVKSPPRVKNPSHLGQGHKAAWQLRASTSKLQTQPPTKELRSKREGDAVPIIDMISSVRTIGAVGIDYERE